MLDFAAADAAASAPAQAEQALVSNAATAHGQQVSPQHAQQQDQQEQQQQRQSLSEDDSWTPGQPQSSGGDAHAADADLDDDEESWDPNGPPPQYCTNCTARLYQPPTCSDCGHSSEQDGSLFEAISSAESPAGTAAAAAAADRPLIIWDDEMLLHEEGKAVPHPERPDRLRAIMARLVGNGLAGAACRNPFCSCAVCVWSICLSISLPPRPVWLLQTRPLSSRLADIAAAVVEYLGLHTAVISVHVSVCAVDLRGLPSVLCIGVCS
jgi:hypothetical protein